MLVVEIDVAAKRAAERPIPMRLANPRHQASVLVRALTERTDTPGKPLALTPNRRHSRLTG